MADNLTSSFLIKSHYTSGKDSQGSQPTFTILHILLTRKGNGKVDLTISLASLKEPN